MKITVTFPDFHQETFWSIFQATYAIGMSFGSILSAIRNGKKKIIRKRDKAEFQIEAEDYPKIKLQKEDREVFVFSTLREAEDYFSLPYKSLSSKLSRNDPSIISKKQKCFLTILEHNLKPFPRQVEAKEKALFQRTSRGPQYLYIKGITKTSFLLFKFIL